MSWFLFGRVGCFIIREYCWKGRDSRFVVWIQELIWKDHSSKLKVSAWYLLFVWWCRKTHLKNILVWFLIFYLLTKVFFTKLLIYQIRFFKRFGGFSLRWHWWGFSQSWDLVFKSNVSKQVRNQSRIMNAK